jgi:type IV pilus assembly protein PilB
VQQNEDYVLQALQDVGLVTRPQIESARSRLNGANNIVDVLVKDGVVSESDVSRTLAGQAHMDWIDISSMLIPPEVIKQIRAEDARRFKVVPIAFGETGLVVAVSDPLDIDTIDSLSFLLQREIELVCSSPEKFVKRSSSITAPLIKLRTFCRKSWGKISTSDWKSPKARKRRMSTRQTRQ